MEKARFKRCGHISRVKTYSSITATTCLADNLLTVDKVDVQEYCISGTSEPVRQLSMRACLGALSNSEIKLASSAIEIHRDMCLRGDSCHFGHLNRYSYILYICFTMWTDLLPFAMVNDKGPLTFCANIYLI